jgi:hypothetical protein
MTEDLSIGWRLVIVGELIVDTLPRRFLRAIGSKLEGEI